MPAVALAVAAGALPAVAARAAAGSRIAFDRVSVAYRDAVALQPLTLEIAAGEIVALIGPSGSGKSTALRAVAGFVRPATGRIHIGDTDVTDLPPYRRGIGMVVQNYALFPHMRVEDNVAFGLRAQRAPRDSIAGRVSEVLDVVGMGAFARRYPRELSGGQQQRIAIARALAVRPRVLLLDEPLSALDAQIRRNMVEEIARLHREFPQLTILYVTHDQAEALTLADRIALMRDGALVSYGLTADLYRRPPDRFTAEFLGRANLLPVVVTEARRADGLARVQLGESSLLALAGGAEVGERRLLCIRPQHAALEPGPERSNRVSGVLKAINWQGELTAFALEVEAAAMRVVVTRPPATSPGVGGTVECWFSPHDASLIPEPAVG